MYSACLFERVFFELFRIAVGLAVVAAVLCPHAVGQAIQIDEALRRIAIEGISGIDNDCQTVVVER